MQADYLEILKSEIVPALGCTEPIAVALAVAKSAEVLAEEATKINVYVSRNILKNAMGVGIPGTNMVGLEIAAALAYLAGKSKYQLEVLRDITSIDIKNAEEMVANKKINVFLKETEEKLYVEAVCKNDKNNATTIIKRVHTDIYSVTLNGKEIFAKDEVSEEQQESFSYEMIPEEIYNFIATTDIKSLEFLEVGIEMNKAVSVEGLKNIYGLSIGKHLYKDLVAIDGVYADATNFAIAITSAASDARMAGCPLPVMSTAGSGNQGLTATLPVIAVAQNIGSSNETLLRAIALSQLITIYIKKHIGKLSAICGCATAASVGASCGITYLKGGEYINIVYAIKNMIADISGLICDGAKSSCSLKIATAVGSAIRCSSLALSNTVISDKDGIIDISLEKTVDNLGKLATDGMAYTDKVILDMMVCK